MTRACIVNVNDYGLLIAEYLKANGRIVSWRYANNARICMDFDKELTISFQDYLEVHPLKDYIKRSEGRIKMEKNDFNRRIITEIVRTLQGGEITEYIPGERITIKPTEKTVTICFRVTHEEKQRIEGEAKGMGTTVSDYIRSKIL